MKELNSLEMDDWFELYSQVIYAIEFDSRRLNGDKNKPAKFPL